MADISKITLPNNSSYNIKDAIARNKLNVLTNNMATCVTGRATAAKVATLANFSLNVGATIAVKFTDTAGTANPTSGNLTLNVNGTGAKNIGYFRNGNKAALMHSYGGYFFNNQTHIFTYDGTYWLYMDWNADNNTDTKVTSVRNHYTPAKFTTKSASGGTLTDITNSTSGTQVVTGVEMDAKGHVTGVTSVALKSTDSKVTVDTALSSTSTNPVQNKVINSALAGKAAASHSHTISQISDFPASLPANGGNADTVGGKSPSDFLPFQAYAPIYTGDIKDISNMGTYSCYKGNCTNLPDIDMWAYVIMIRFRDVGYKTFLCIEFNARPTTQHCRNIYIAREYDVDSSGNMIWYKACDGGNADTVGGVGITNLRQITQTVINTLPTVPNGEGDFLVSCDTSDTSFPYWYGHLSIRYGSYTGEYVAIFRTTGNDNKVYYNTYLTNHWHGWINVADGGNAATVNGRSAFRIPTLDGSGNLWDASTPNINDLYAQWDASKQYFKLKTFGGNNVAVDIATSNTASLQCTADGTITGLSNGAAKTVSLPFSPVFVLFHSNGHVVQGGFALSCGTNSFTITPANVSTMGSTAVGYIAFGR